VSKESEAGSQFKVLYADPPWEYRHKVTGPNGRGAASHNYSTLSFEQIRAFALPEIAEDAFLWLWITNPVLAEGWHVEICKAWGFKPQTILTWVKRGIGMGYTLRSATEHCLVARRGHPKVLNHGVPTWFEAPRGKHSEKPESARKIIKQVQPSTCFLANSSTNGPSHMVSKEMNQGSGHDFSGEHLNPCQDGDECHYAGENPMKPSDQAGSPNRTISSGMARYEALIAEAAPAEPPAPKKGEMICGENFRFCWRCGRILYCNEYGHYCSECKPWGRS
jgi:N6-adenosine-specific RNA methylase IME4